MKVSLCDVSKVFEDGQSPLAALAPITLEISTGEFIAFIGPSGCGKSTLLRLVGDQIKPTRGHILLDGSPPSKVRARKAIGWMAQSPALLPWASVLENVRLPLKINQEHRRPAPSPETLLEMMDLLDFAPAYPRTLSGGMQQRVALARTLSIGAPLWLMDEPFAALDALTREALADEVLRLWLEFRPTILWVTHNIGEAVRLADRVVVLTARPGHVRAVVEIPYPRPRDTTAHEIASLVRKLRELLGNKSVTAPSPSISRRLPCKR
ncbi:MAG: ABC transporter ATP-binding protein [Anaerolineae bacterium]